MKIAYLTGQYARASDTFIRNEVIELRRRGHDVRTFSIRREMVGASAGEEVLNEQRSTTYVLEQGALKLIGAVVWALLSRPTQTIAALRLALSIRVKGLKGLFLQCAYLTEAAYLARELRKDDVNILHNHIAENSATVAMLASVIGDVPFSMTVHGPGIFFHPKQWALGEKVARSAFTVAITDFCRSQCMLFSERVHWPKIHVVRCATGPGFQVGRITPPSREPRFLFVGRLCAEKGLPILIDAFADAVKQGVAMRLVLVGDGPMRAEIEAAAKQHGFEDALTMMGFQPSHVVREELERCRVFVLPSFAEGLPVAIMEAFAMGRPVITTQIAGIPELVAHGRNGWLVPPGSTESLARAMVEAASCTESQLQDMSAHAVASVNARHDFSREIDKLEALLVQHGARKGGR